MGEDDDVDLNCTFLVLLLLCAGSEKTTSMQISTGLKVSSGRYLPELNMSSSCMVSNLQ